MVFRFKYWLMTVLCRRFCAGNENVKPLQTICCIFCRRMNLSEESLKGKKVNWVEILCIWHAYLHTQRPPFTKRLLPEWEEWGRACQKGLNSMIPLRCAHSVVFVGRWLCFCWGAGAIYPWTVIVHQIWKAWTGVSSSKYCFCWY